jgi:hypothetical protein
MKITALKNPAELHKHPVETLPRDADEGEVVFHGGGYWFRNGSRWHHVTETELMILGYAFPAWDALDEKRRAAPAPPSSSKRRSDAAE